MLKKGIEILKKKEIKQSLVTLLLRVIGVVTLFVFTIFFNRNYPASVVGDYEFTRMFLLVTGGICIIGTDVSILYFSGKLKSEDSFYLIKSLYYKVVSLFLLFCFFLFVFFYLFFSESLINSFFGSDNSYIIVKYSIIFLIFNVLTLFNTEVLRALDQVVLSELFRNTFKFFPIFFGAIILYKSNNQGNIINYYIIGFVLLSIITFIFILYFFSKLKKLNNNSIRRKISYREIIKYSLPMGISSLIIYLLSTIDIIIIRNYFSSNEVAYYALGVKLMAILGMINLSINVNVSPKISELYQNKDYEGIKSLLKKSSWIIFGLNLFAGLVIIFSSDLVLPIFGEEYLNSKNVLIVLVLGQILISSFGSVAIYLNMTGRPDVFRGILLIAVIINLLLNYKLIPTYGIIGGAISYIITMLFWNIVATIYIYKKDRVKTFIH